MERVGLIGFGRFGQTLAQLLKPQCTVFAYDSKKQPPMPGVTFADLDTVLQERYIIVAVPMRDFEEVIQTITPHLSLGATVIDVCSVKTYPVKIMQQYLPAHIGIIATHPLFGPDSISTPTERKIVMHNVRDINGAFQQWQDIFTHAGLKVMLMSPEQHDQLVAETQGLTHFTGRMLQHVGMHPNELSTVGYQKLLDVTTYTCNDTWDLFFDMQNFNPYAKAIRKKILAAVEELDRKIDNP